MRIGVIGGGAIGLLFTAYLSETDDHDVTLFVRRVNQRDLILNQGITLYADKMIQSLPNVALVTQDLHELDLVIITVKQYHLKGIYSLLKGVKLTATILFIQNGMSHIDQLSQIHNEHILLGVVDHGATKLSDCSVAHKGMGTTKVGAYKGSIERIKQLSTARFTFNIQEDWWLMLIEKLFINHAINPLTALYKVTNGKLVTNQYFNLTMRHLFDEALTVFEIPQSTILWEKINRICTNTDENRSSMLQDIESGRHTEIDAISGYVLKKAKKLGQDCPLTEFIVLSIKGLEGSQLKNRD